MLALLLMIIERGTGVCDKLSERVSKLQGSTIYVSSLLLFVYFLVLPSLLHSSVSNYFATFIPVIQHCNIMC